MMTSEQVLRQHRIIAWSTVALLSLLGAPSLWEVLTR
jgi:hypothetical protein